MEQAQRVTSGLAIQQMLQQAARLSLEQQEQVSHPQLLMQQGIIFITVRLPFLVLDVEQSPLLQRMLLL